MSGAGAGRGGEDCLNNQLASPRPSMKNTTPTLWVRAIRKLARQQTAFLHGFCLMFPCEPLPWLCLMMDHVWGGQAKKFLPSLELLLTRAFPHSNGMESRACAMPELLGVVCGNEPAAGFLNLVCTGPRFLFLLAFSYCLYCLDMLSTNTPSKGKPLGKVDLQELCVYPSPLLTISQALWSL